MIINATLCYLKRNQHTLMLLRNKKANDIHQGKWNGLGGKLEHGESPEECARREILEESGLTAHGLCMKGILTFPMFDGNNDWLVFVFVTHQFSGTLVDSCEGELRWISDNDLPGLPLWEGDRVFMKWLDKTAFFSGKFVYQNGKLLNHSVVFYSCPDSDQC